MPSSKRATSDYERLWNRADKLFGANGSASPYVKFRAKGEAHRAWVGDGPFHEKAVYVSPKMTRQLSKQPRNTGARAERRARRVRKGAKRDLLHEWAHVYQTGPIYTDYGLREGAAQKFANQAARKLLNYKAPDVYKKPRRQYVKSYGAKHWRREQFGDNYGADPRTIKQAGQNPFYDLPNPYWRKHRR